MRALLAILCLIPSWALAAISAGTFDCDEYATTDALDGYTVSIDAGSNRVLVATLQRAYCSSSCVTTFTVGGQTATATDHQTGSTILRHNYVWIWDEAAIQDMSGSDVSFAQANSDDTAVCFVTLTGVEQNFAGFGFTDEQTCDSCTTDNVDTTSTSSQYVCAMAHSELNLTTYSGWDTLTEQMDLDPNTGRAGVACGTGGDNTTAISWSQSDDVISASFLFSEASVTDFSIYRRRGR